jgi:pimeloyl-ACP methyl ester carboxylesterase
MDRAASFAKVARRLREVDDLEVLMFDRAGYGTRVDEPAPTDRIAGDVDDLLARVGDDPVVVIGHSYGGHVALGSALRRPGVVVAVGAFETPLAWMPWWPPRRSGGIATGAWERTGSAAEAAEAFMRSIVGDEVWSRLPPSTKAARRAEGPAMLADLVDIKRPPPYDPADVAVPVVVGRGSQSKGQHLDGTKALLDLVPDAELHIVEGAGHGAHTSHPDGFTDFVRHAAARAT